jgi:hypothetical protein
MNETSQATNTPLPDAAPEPTPKQKWETPELRSVDIQDTEKGGTGLDVDMEAS